jgi:hypothetical protein
MSPDDGDRGGSPATAPPPALIEPADRPTRATTPVPRTRPGAGIASAVLRAGRRTRTSTQPLALLASPATALAVLAALFALAALLAWRSMPAGPISGNDSVTYLAVARNLAAGKGLTSPFGHELTGLSPDEGAELLGTAPLTAWPPLYPIALAAGTPLGLTVESTSRLLGVLAAGATAALTAMLARRLGASLVAGALAAVVVTVSLPAVLSFAALSSEALYLPLSLLALVALTRAAGTWPGEPGRALDLGVFAAAAAAATLTRHAGVALIATGVLLLSAWHTRSRHASATALALGGAAALLPAVALVWARTRPGWRSGPAFASRLGDLGDAGRAVARWLVPATDASAPVVAATVMVVALMIIGAVLAVVAARTRHPAPIVEDPARRAPWQPTLRTSLERRAGTGVVIMYALAYTAVVGLTGSFLDHGVPFDARLALPLLPPLAALVAAGGDAAVNLPTRPWARPAVAAALLLPGLVVVVANARVSHEQVWSRSLEGVWTPPPRYPTMDLVAALPQPLLVFANQPSAVFALSSRPVLALPVVRSPMTGAANPHADRDVDQLVTRLRERRAVVVLERATVWLDAGRGQPLVGEEELRARLAGASGGPRVPLVTLSEDTRFVVLGPPDLPVT